MKRYAMSIGSAVAMLIGTACQTVSGSGNVVTRQIEVTPFSRLLVSGPST